MKCRRLLTQTEDIVITCGEHLTVSDSLLCGATHTDITSTLVYFGSYGSTQSTKEVEEYANACADIRLTSRILDGQTVQYASSDLIVMTLSNVADGSLTITFPSSVRSEVIAKAYAKETDSNEDIDVTVEGDTFSSIEMTIPTGVSVVSIYFTMPQTLDAITIDDCKNALISYTKQVHTTKWSPNKITFADKQEGVASSLMQRLNVIEGELWYNVKEGLPLFNKNVTITSMDAWLIRTIMKHPDVVSILTFSSTLNDHKYSATTHILSKYGELDLRI